MLYQLLVGLLRYSRSCSRNCPNFLDKTDQRFHDLRGACDTVTKKLRRDGIGTQVKHADIFTLEEEEKLWSSGSIGTHSPTALVRVVFYSVGKALCLRGGQEQCSLRPSQFECKRGPDRYVYVEKGSKNCQRVFGKDCWDNKVVTLFHNETAAERCPVYLLDLYFSKFTKPVTELDFF